MIDEALRFKRRYEDEHSRAIDRLWVVFDRVSFSAGDFNGAVQRCKNSKPEIGAPGATKLLNYGISSTSLTTIKV